MAEVLNPQKSAATTFDFWDNIYFIQFVVSIRDNYLGINDILGLVYTLLFRFLSLEVMIFIMSYFLFIM